MVKMLDYCFLILSCCMLVCLCFVLIEFGNIAGFYIRLHSLCKFFSYAHPVLMQLNAI